MITLTNQLGVSSVYTYDKSGRKVAQTDAVGTNSAYTLRFGYDVRGRQTVITYPNGTTAKSTFDDAGNQLTKIDQGGFTTSYGYDALNRLLSVTNPASEKVNYRYDAAGRLKAIVDAKTHETGFDYDELGRVTKKTWANGSFEQFGYDNLTGNKTSHRLADGNTNTFKYDLMNRVSEVKYYDIATTYLVTYTANGLRSQVSDDRGLTSYSYNRRDLLTSYTQPVKDGANFFSQRVDYSYNPAGSRSSVETFMGASGVPSTSVSYGYDAAYQLLNVTQSGVATATTYLYDDLGRRTNTALSNGANVKYEYAANAPNQLLAVKHFFAGLNPNVATPSVSYAYFYTSTNPFGNANLRTGLVESKNGSTTANYTWDYDQAFRVATETLQAGSTITTTGYGYDGAGNRTEWRLKVGASAPTTVTYQVDELDRLLSTNNGVSGGEVYGYNNRGNLIQIKQNGTVQKSFTWDGADRLTSVLAANGTTAAAFKYDFDGRRVQQQITTTTATHSLWDITTRYGDVLLETSYSGSNPNAKATYVYGQACGSCSRNPVAELISQKKGASNPEYFLLDGQGSVRGLTSNSGTLVTGSEFSYDTFGKPTAGDANKSSYLYTGQQYDSASELYSLRARYYSPQQGRFLSRDTWPVDFKHPMELNRYAYTANNPVNYKDPSGYSFDENSKINEATGALEGLAGRRVKVVALGALIGSLAVALIAVTLIAVAFTFSERSCAATDGIELCTTTFSNEGTVALGVALGFLTTLAGFGTAIAGGLSLPVFPAALLTWVFIVSGVELAMLAGLVIFHGSVGGGYVQFLTAMPVGATGFKQFDIAFCRASDKVCGNRQKLLPR